jgi:hypothetical protein
VALIAATLAAGARWNPPAVRDAGVDGPRTEHEWLVGAIVRDLSEMIWRAAGRLPDGGGRLQVRVVQEDPRQPRVTVTLAAADGSVLRSGVVETKHFVWSPRDYQTWAAALLRAGGVAPSDSSQDEDGGRLIEALLEPTAAVLHREAAEVSESLEQDVRIASRHEDAALVLGAFALREAAGEFADTRALLSRMAAHLATARALRERSGPTGSVAEAVLLVLAGRQAEAMQALDALANDARLPEASRSAWTAALRLRATDDWRQQPPGRSLLERREHYRALVTGYDPLHADELVDDRVGDEIPDRARISLQRLESAPQAYRHLRGALEREREELRAIWLSARRSPFDLTTNAAELDDVADGWLEEDGGRLHPRVLQWADWASAYQRHACMLADKEQTFFNQILDSGDIADEKWVAARKELGGLRLFPLVEQRRARTPADYARAMTRSVALVTAHPEQVTVQNWLALQKPPGFAPRHAGVPSADAWFTGFPAGTTYDSYHRMEHLARLRAADVGTAEALRALAPYDHGVVGQLIVHKYPVQRSAADIGREFGERSHYDPLVMHWMAKCCADTDPALFREVTERLCRLDPERCIRVANQLADRGADQAAALAFQRAVDHGLDRSLVADQDWLTRYYYERGERAQAMKVARAVAATGTIEGMETLGRLLERMGRFGEARSVLHSAEERHGGSDALMQFLHRRGPAAHDEFVARTRHIFPDGLEGVTLAELDQPPRDGIRIGSEHDNLRKAGVGIGGIIVAVDGFRVRSVIQYHVVRGFELGREMELIVWNGSAYRDVRVAAPRRLLEANLVTYGR